MTKSDKECVEGLVITVLTSVCVGIAARSFYAFLATLLFMVYLDYLGSRWSSINDDA